LGASLRARPFFMDDPFKEAQKNHEQGNLDEAEKYYDMVLTQNWDHAGLLASMGTLYLQKSKHGLAISMLRRALEKIPQSDAMSNLSLAYKGSGQTEEAIKWAEKACNTEKPSAMAFANYSGFFTNTGSPEKAIPLCEKALSIDNSVSVAHWNLGLALLESGQWERGWKEHEWGLRMQKGASVMRVDRDINGLPYWDGTPGKPVAVYGEQGLGDEIMFASMLPDLMKTNPVVIECHHRLKTLFERSFGATCYGTREDTAITWPNNHPELAYRVSVGSLGQFFRNKAEDFPGTHYLKADPIPKGEKFRVGISWTGGQRAGRVVTRTVPLSWWRSILDNTDVEFVSLQYTDCAAEIDLMEKQGYSIKQYPEITEKEGDYYNTARIVQSCDLVISVCTSVIHLAGALGVPCWVMVPSKPAWRYGVSGGMRWYRSVRLYRQQESWIPVVERVGFDLSELLKMKKEEAA
jgi:hypothetical protein